MTCRIGHSQIRTKYAQRPQTQDWRGFLDSLVARGLRGVRFITSDDHAGLPIGIWAARKAVFPGASWQRCQFHLARGGALAG